MPGFSKIQHADEAVNRIQGAIQRAVDPLLAAATRPDAGWVAIAMQAPWSNFDPGGSHASLCGRQMLDGSFAIKGCVSTIGGARAGAAFGNQKSNSPGTTVSEGSIICQLNGASAPKETRLLPMQWAAGWDASHNFFARPCAVALVPATSSTPASLQYQGTMDGVFADYQAAVAIEALYLELRWVP